MEKRKVISVCDTIHDFKDLKKHKNKFYEAFVKEYDGPETSTIEDYVMEYMEIDGDDDNEKIDPEYIRQNTKPYFTSKIYELTSSNFKHLLWSLCDSHYQTNEDIKIIADANGLPYSLLCDFGNEIKIPKLILTEASRYDRLIDKPTYCFQNRPTTASLFKEDGNLFGLNFINVNTVNGISYMKYNYTKRESNSKSQSTNDDIEIKLDEYIKNYNGTDGKLKAFLADVVKNMYERYFNKKRKNPVELKSSQYRPLLLELLKKAKKVYKLRYKEFGFYDEDTDTVSFDKYSKHFVSILFDFKRAGDQLQAESAKQSNSIFVSLDKIAIAYAYHIGVPCIKTSEFGANKDDIDQDIDLNDEQKTKKIRKKLMFYNFHKDAVINSINNKKFYIVSIESSLKTIQEYERFLALLSQNYNTVNILMLQKMIFNTIQKSIKILNLNPTQDKQRVSARSKEQKNINIYKYRYFTQFNALIHIFLFNILEHILHSSVINQYRQFVQECEASDQSLESLKQIFDKIENNMIYKFIKCLNISDNRNTDYIQLILKYYYHNFPGIRILYDREDPTMNIYNMMPQNSLITDYINANTAKYPDIKSKTFKKQNIEINTNILKEYNDAINNTIMDIQLTMPVLQNYLDLQNELEKQSSLQQQQSFFEGIYYVNEDILDNMKQLEAEGELDKNKMRIKLEIFMQNDLENDKSKVSKILASISEDIIRYKDLIDHLFNDTFVDDYILKPHQNRVQSGGGRQLTSHYDLFVKELDYIYNDRDKHTNDFTKLLLIFFVKSLDIFKPNGNFSQSFTKYYYKRLTSSRSRSRSKTNSASKFSSKRSTPVSIAILKTKSTSKSLSKHSAASTVSHRSNTNSASKRSAASTISSDSQHSPIKK